jgi:FkbM family methyltransferase
VSANADERDVGRGRTYREPGWLERLAAPFRSLVARAPFGRAIRRVYESLLASMPGADLSATLPGGERVLIHPANRQLAWNEEEYAAFKAAIRPGGVVLDVGANVGAYTVLFAKWVGPAGRVYAFEPAPETRAALERQVALNGVADRVVVRPEAVAAATGTRAFQAAGLRGDNRLASAFEAGIEVQTIALDDFCARHAVTPDFIKIDVEGVELEALRGGRRAIAAASARGGVFVELHPAEWPRIGVTRESIESELRSQGLALSRIDGGRDPWSIEGVCLRLAPA